MKYKVKDESVSLLIGRYRLFPGQSYDKEIFNAKEFSIVEKFLKDEKLEVLEEKKPVAPKKEVEVPEIKEEIVEEPVEETPVVEDEETVEEETSEPKTYSKRRSSKKSK